MALQESIGSSTVLGLTTPNALALVNALEEAKMKKKMMGEVPVPSDDDEDSEEEEEVDGEEETEEEPSEEDDEEDETGDGEVVDPASSKDDPEQKLFMKKKMKKDGKDSSCKKCKGKKCMCKKMKKENADWVEEIKSMLKYDPSVKHSDGTNTTVEMDKSWDGISRPLPGQVGFSPHTRLGF